MKKILIYILLLLGLIFSVNALPFSATWDTTKTEVGVSTNSNQVKLPLEASGTYNFTVNWGDGSPLQTITVWNSPLVTHTYSTPGIYTIIITGQIDGFRFNGVGDRWKIQSITSWGPDFRLGNNGEYFFGCQFLNLPSVLDVLNLTGTTILRRMFNNCYALTSVNNINLWDTSQVTNMSSVFTSTQFNSPIGDWDTSQVTNMGSMFSGNQFFNQPINTWTTSQVTNMFQMLSNALSFNQNIGGWDLGSITAPLGMQNMLDNTAISVANFDTTLCGWALQSGTLTQFINVGANGLSYSNATGGPCRTTLQSSPNNWAIVCATGV
jgi:surface protein